MVASTLIVPVESQVREMDAKLLLACVAAERGIPVILGSRAYIHFDVASMPRGVYLAKSMRKLSTRMFKILRQLGHNIVGWDEEGLVRLPDTEYYRQRLSACALQHVTQLFAWGPDNAQVLRNFPGCDSVPVEITGNPRVDLMRRDLVPYFEDDVQSIRKRFGDFILVNTNFSGVNPFVPAIGVLKKLLEDQPNSDTKDYMRGRAAHKLEMFYKFKMMLPTLCQAFPKHNIVVRPHPSEDLAPWKLISRDHKNLHVANDGSITAWLLATLVLVANGCTTSVEAGVLGIPSINYQPVQSSNFDLPLPTSVSHTVFDADQLIDSIRTTDYGAISNGAPAELEHTLRQHIAALDGPLASDRIVDALERAGYNEQQAPPPQLGEFAAGWIKNKFRTITKRINMHRRDHRNNIHYHAHRFPDISILEIRDRIRRLQRLLGRFSDVHVNQNSKHIFRFHS